MLPSEGRTSGYKGAAPMSNDSRSLDHAGQSDGDADWPHTAPTARDNAACIPRMADRRVKIPNDCTLHCKRHRIDNMVGGLENWRRTHTFMSVLCAAVVVFGCER